MYKAPAAERRPVSGLPPILAHNLNCIAGPAALQSARAMAGFGRMAAEWLSFVQRRLGEDAQLAGQLAAAKSPAEFWGRYADFLQTAVQDYWEEYAALTKLSCDIAHAGQEAGGEPTAQQQHAPPVAHAA